MNAIWLKQFERSFFIDTIAVIVITIHHLLVFANLVHLDKNLDLIVAIAEGWVWWYFRFLLSQKPRKEINDSLLKMIGISLGVIMAVLINLT